MTDAEYILVAWREALKGEGHTRPNPPVGAVLVRDGQIIGCGHHRKCGCDHAEVEAIKNARRRKKETTGATIYVTLEPCSKPGRVGACTEAIADAGIVRVVYAVADPNPTNAGKAKRALAKHGIACESLSTLRPPVASGEEALTCWKSACEKTRTLIAPFSKHVRTGWPYVTIKLAMSLDGKICDDAGHAKWVSSVRSRRCLGTMRERVDAILVGAETVRQDNPSLLSHGKRNDDLIRVIVSKSGKLPKKAQVFTDGAPNETRVYRDAKEALADLGKRGVLHVLCEGGLKLARYLADEGLVDGWRLVTSPIVIGSRPLAQARRFKLASSAILDPDAGDRIGDYRVFTTKQSD